MKHSMNKEAYEVLKKIGSNAGIHSVTGKPYSVIVMPDHIMVTTMESEVSIRVERYYEDGTLTIDTLRSL